MRRLRRAFKALIKLLLFLILPSLFLIGIALVLRAPLAIFPIALAIAAALAIPSWYLDRLYDLGGLWKGLEYLQISAFEWGLYDSWLLVKEGAVQKDRTGYMTKIGGPGLLIVYNDSAVVTECRGAIKRVLGPGTHLLERFERVWEVVDLRPQRWVYPVNALTRDGIPVSCEVDVLFKIDDRPEGSESPLQPTAKRPHPFTEEAVLRAATATRIREEQREDPVMKWTGRVVIGSAEGALRNILGRHRLDQLVQPEEKKGTNPLLWKEIRKELEDALKKSAPQVGARIISVDIGRIDIQVSLPEGEEEAAKELRDGVLDQWIRTWQSELERDLLTLQAEGEATLAGLEAVSAQAKAEMVLTLVEAIQSLVTQEEVSAYQVALRLIETLRWMTFDPGIRAFVPLEPLRFLEKLRETIERAALPQPPQRPAQRAGGKGKEG